MAGNPLKHQDVLDELLADGSMVLFHRASRELLTINPAAALVWEHCDGRHRPSEIVAALQDVFPGVQTLAGDVDAVLRDFAARGMLAFSGE